MIVLFIVSLWNNKIELPKDKFDIITSSITELRCHTSIKTVYIVGDESNKIRDIAFLFAKKYKHVIVDLDYCPVMVKEDKDRYIQCLLETRSMVIE